MKKLSIIIIGSDKVDKKIITSAWDLSPYEVIVVKSDKKSDNSIEHQLGCKVIFSEELSRNQGYIKAAKKASGDALLFLHGNIIIQPSMLFSFVQPLLNGQVHVVLNNLNPIFFERRVKHWPDSYTLWREILNDSLGHNKLNIDSLTSFPHAYTKEVIQSIGYESFENLVIAHMRILEQGWSISRQIAIELSNHNEFLPAEQCNYRVELNDAERQNMKKYLGALAEWHKVHGLRGNYHDGGRRRDIIANIKKCKGLSDYQKKSSKKPIIYKGWGMNSTIYQGKQLSVIIPAQNEESTIAAVIQEARKIEPLEIIVVVNGSTDKTELIAKQLGATVIVFQQALGHDVGRAIGALEATGEILLFTDADFPISAHDLQLFSLAVANGVDMALNDLNIDVFPLYIVNLYKYMLNMACNRKDLGVGSIVAVPHAISRSCLEGISWDLLLNPCLAQVKAILDGYQVTCVHFVDVMKPNRIRPDQHFSSIGHPKAVLRINGDHLEAIAYLNDPTKNKN